MSVGLVRGRLGGSGLEHMCDALRTPGISGDAWRGVGTEDHA